MNLPIRDESEDEDEVEENARLEAILNPEEERHFRAISKIGKRPKFEVPIFSRNLNLEELIIGLVNWRSTLNMKILKILIRLSL